MRSVSPKATLSLHATQLPSMGTTWPCPPSYCAFPPCPDTLQALCHHLLELPSIVFCHLKPVSLSPRHWAPFAPPGCHITHLKFPYHTQRADAVALLSPLSHKSQPPQG